MEISIVIPCYNEENNIKRCIDSVKKQSYEDFEVILVDDGSTDKTAEVIKKNIEGDKRFKYYHKENGGVSSARNYGIKKAAGSYISFIDSDDYIDPDFLKLLYENIKENNGDISICYYNRVYDSSTKEMKFNKEYHDLIKFPAPWGKLYKTSLFTENNLYYPEGKWYEDLGVFSKLLMLNPKISLVEKPLLNYMYLQNSDSIMHSYDNRIYQIYDIMEDIEKFAKENGIYEKNIDKIEFIYIYHVLIGTIYRSSFLDDFDKNTIKKIVRYVEDKYPNWHNNKYIQTLPLTFKIYLFCLNNNFNKLLEIMLKKFNEKMNL